jgi:hypothetical protein
MADLDEADMARRADTAAATHVKRAARALGLESKLENENRKLRTALAKLRTSLAEMNGVDLYRADDQRIDLTFELNIIDTALEK